MNNLFKRIKSMLSVDIRRMFTMPLIYILVGSVFVMPILILVMTTAFDGQTTVNPSTGVETTIQGFENVWQIISSLSTADSMSMDMTSMCNLNLLYFIVAVLVCIFISDDFRSGYAKNLFTTRAKKSEYVISKTITCFIGGSLMIIAFFMGSMIGGAIAGLSFDLGNLSITNVVMCLISKIFLMLVFVGIYTVMSVIAKSKLWLSMCLSFGVSMFLFMMIPMLSPLDATIMNVILALVGGVIFSVGLGYVSNLILNKTNIL